MIVFQFNGYFELCCGGYSYIYFDVEIYKYNFCFINIQYFYFEVVI